MKGTVLYFLGCKPRLEEGAHWSDVRCDCSSRANLCATVREGKVVEAGCPVCKLGAVCEVTPDGRISFFPPGIQVL